MTVKIRLKRVGKRKQPSYRIVVIDSMKPRDGRRLDLVGFYNPLKDPAEIRFDTDKVRDWISRGARPSATVASLLKKAGITKTAMISGQEA